MTINFQRLLDVCRATELLPLGGFNMRVVVNECGTAGCAIGNYNAMVGRNPRTFMNPFTKDFDHEHFGITTSEYSWLFGQASVKRGRLGLKSEDYLRLETNWGGPDLERGLSHVTQSEVLARLRKFIYYKLHKHEMTYDAKYGVREEGRTKEGDHYFAKRAVESAVSCAAV